MDVCTKDSSRTFRPRTRFNGGNGISQPQVRSLGRNNDAAGVY